VRRREFITLLSGAVVTWPIAARAQQRDQVPRIGVLMSASENDPEGHARITAFREGLEKLGWTDGQNVRIDVRWTAGDAALDRKFAAELVTLTPNVILASREIDAAFAAIGRDRPDAGGINCLRNYQLVRFGSLAAITEKCSHGKGTMLVNCA
jgi:hypothetical protein